MNVRHRARWCLIGMMACLGALSGSLWAMKPAKDPGQPAAAEKADAKSDGFLRVLRDSKDRAVAMQTAVVHYVPKKAGKDKLSVDLIGAVHVGDADYYRQLNKLFEQYDAVLYELVAPQGTRVPREGARSSHPVGMLQHGMTGVLDLAYQLNSIDYHQDNLVHADMSPADFSKSMTDRGESLLSMVFRMMGYGLAQQSKTGGSSVDARLLSAMWSKNRPLALKRIMAEQFEDLEGAMGAFDSPQGGSTLITERNKVALDVLRQQIGEGKKKLAIFYGAGHLPDMEKRLEADFNLRREQTRWLTAWDMHEPADESPKEAAKETSPSKDRQPD